MNDLQFLSKKIISNLPKQAKTKLNKSRLDRGGDGIFTKRRKRNDVVFISYESFVNNYKQNLDTINSIFLDGYYILLSPKEFSENRLIFENLPIIVHYTSYNEISEYPFDESKITRKSNDGVLLGNIVVNIKNLDKFKKDGQNLYLGEKLIAQNEFDYATKEEQDKVIMCLLYSMINMKNFYNFVSSETKLLCEKFLCEFELSELYTLNPNLIKLTSERKTKCPILNFHLDFSDVMNGVIEGDIGRNDFNRTTTKINLHHLDRLQAGKLNHNHKNVFLGSYAGNMIDASLNQIGLTIDDLKRLLIT
jgi:hypothetical protein